LSTGPKGRAPQSKLDQTLDILNLESRTGRIVGETIREAPGPVMIAG
jgi:hypothetical protein